MFRNKKYDMQRDDIWYSGQPRHRKTASSGRALYGGRANHPPWTTDRSIDEYVAHKRQKAQKERNDKDKPLYSAIHLHRRWI